MGFFGTFFVFISAVIAGLALMVGGRKMSPATFRILASFHAMFLFAFLASLMLRSSGPVNAKNYFFTAFICSGLVLSGLAWRIQLPKPARIYFSLFIICIPLFLISPSMLLNFLVTGNYSSTTGEAVHLRGRFYLERQNTFHETGEVPYYKVIAKRGLFHKTIQRDIVFGGSVDSVKVLDLDSGRMSLRGYFSRKTHVSLDTDSTDVEIDLAPKKQGSVEYRL